MPFNFTKATISIKHITPPMIATGIFPAIELFTRSSPSLTILNKRITRIIELLFCNRPKMVTAAVAILRERNKPKGPANDRAPAAGKASQVPSKASGFNTRQD